MSVMTFQIAGVYIVCLTVCLSAGQRKRQSSASLAPVRGIHRWPVDSPHEGAVTRKMLDDVIMYSVIKQKWCKYLMGEVQSPGQELQLVMPEWQPILIVLILLTYVKDIRK